MTFVFVKIIKCNDNIAVKKHTQSLINLNDSFCDTFILIIGTTLVEIFSTDTNCFVGFQKKCIVLKVLCIYMWLEVSRESQYEAFLTRECKKNKLKRCMLCSGFFFFFIQDWWFFLFYWFLVFYLDLKKIKDCLDKFVSY